jgi:PAS domain S-box-containing protein
MNYYIFGIFKGAPHPTKKTVYNKFNPLQRMIYLGLKILVIPIQVVSGFAFLYYIYPDSIWHSSGIENIAFIHTIGAFTLIAFVIAHVYLTTTGHTPTESIYAMLTGYEILDVDDKEIRNEQLVKAVENSIAGYYRIDKNGILIDVNKAWLDLYKCNDKSQYIGKHYSITRAEKDVNLLESCINDAFKGENVNGVFTKRKCFDGTIEQHILSMNPISIGGEVVEVEGFIIDMSKTENEADYLPYIIKHSKAAYYKLDINGYLLDVNDAWLSLYKYESKSECVGKHFSLFRPSDSNKEYQNIFSKVIAGQTISSTKVARLSKDGSTGYQLVSVNPIFIDDKIMGMEGFILDLN